MKPLIIIGLLFFTNELRAQDELFSQFYEMPFLRNPAWTVASGCSGFVNTLYRNQWNSLSVPYQTLGLTGSGNILLSNPTGLETSYVSLGGQMTLDQAGESKYQNSTILGVFSYHHSFLANGEIGVGCAVGQVQNSLNKRLTWDQQFIGNEYVPGSPGPNLNITGKKSFDLSLGVAAAIPPEDYDWFGQCGIAAYHLLKKNSFLGLDETTPDKRFALNLEGGKTIDENQSFTFCLDYYRQIPNFRTLKTNHSQVIFGGYFTWLKEGSSFSALVPTKIAYLRLGALCRLNDAIIGTVKFGTGSIAFSYSFDLNVLSKLKYATTGNGAMEFGISFSPCFPPDCPKGSAGVRLPKTW